MDFLDGLKGVLKFLTIFPIKVKKGYDSLEKIAENLYFFPIVGLFIGFLAGIFSWIISKILPNFLVGILTLGMILITTGLHHTDGLLDFGDGFLVHGSKNRKLEAMHDPHIGAGGFFIGFIVFSITALCIASLNVGFIIIKGLMASEVIAKFGMVFAMFLGKGAYGGSVSPFVKVMHSKSGTLKFLLAFFLTLILVISLLKTAGLIMLLFGIILCSLIVKVSTLNFGGITGDTIGAINELLRMSTLVILVAMREWL
ncbi:MAG: adenosylcobinamide-GDP ribazoletransferase [Candidatus Bathyarchaeia archaeon]